MRKILRKNRNHKLWEKLTIEKENNVRMDKYCKDLELLNNKHVNLYMNLNSENNKLKEE